MRRLLLLFIHIFFPLCLLSQSGNNIEALLKSKVIKQSSRAYFHKNTSLSKSFINRYVNLTKSFKKHEFLKAKKNKGYRSVDTLMAYKQIKKLNKAGQNVFYQLIRARLLWDYEEHLQRKLLDSAKFNLRNNIDSACYFFTLGIYRKDSLNEILARKLGFVKSDNKGNELVLWERMNSIIMNRWAIMSLMDDGPYKIDISIGDIRDFFIPCFEKAIELDKKEFYYMIEMLLPLIRLEDEKTIQEKIIKYKNNYAINEQKWLEERMNESIARQKKAEESKK